MLTQGHACLETNNISQEEEGPVMFDDIAKVERNSMKRREKQQ